MLGKSSVVVYLSRVVDVGRVKGGDQLASLGFAERVYAGN